MRRSTSTHKGKKVDGYRMLIEKQKVKRRSSIDPNKHPVALCITKYQKEGKFELASFLLSFCQEKREDQENQVNTTSGF